MCINCLNGTLSRRGFLGGTAALAAAAMPFTPFLGSSPAVAQDTMVSPDEAIKRLKDGNARYVGDQSINRDFSIGRAERAQGQRPFAAIVGCADSRLSPEIIFDQGPGDLFVVRVAGNFVDEEGLASLEFGTAVLGCSVIMVLGHSSCGAIEATIDVVQNGTELPGHLPALAAKIRPAVETAIAAKPDDLMVAATIQNVKDNVAYLQTAKPIVADLVSSGKLKIVGGVYELATGMVTPI